jgi:hypothetical protein
MKRVATQDSKQWTIELFKSDRSVVLSVVEKVVLCLLTRFSCCQNLLHAMDVADVLFQSIEPLATEILNKLSGLICRGQLHKTHIGLTLCASQNLKLNYLIHNCLEKLA